MRANIQVKNRFNIEKIAKEMFDFADSGKDVLCILFYDQVCDLLKYVMRRDNLHISNIDLADAFDGYTKEYYVTFLNDKRYGKSIDFFIEPAFVDDTYLDADADVVYMDTNINTDIINHISIGNDNIFIVDFSHNIVFAMNF